MSTTDIPRVPGIEVDPRDLRHLADAQINVELDTGDMILNLGPQHPATHGTLRLPAGLPPATGSREAHRVPHLPADHHAGEPHRLALELRQRGAVHPRGRAADGHRGAAACGVDPHDPHRAVAHRDLLSLPR